MYFFKFNFTVNRSHEYMSITYFFFLPNLVYRNVHERCYHLIYVAQQHIKYIKYSICEVMHRTIKLSDSFFLYTGPYLCSIVILYIYYSRVLNIICIEIYINQELKHCFWCNNTDLILLDGFYENLCKTNLLNLWLSWDYILKVRVNFSFFSPLFLHHF